MSLPIPPKSRANPPRGLSATEALTPLIETTFRTPDITTYINGRETIISNPNPYWTLLDYIRAQPNLKGTKLGCGEGGCGACTVVLQVPDGQSEKKRIKHLSVNAVSMTIRTACEAFTDFVHPHLVSVSPGRH
jgi:xanthine dehydrogenase/oxidase